MDEERRVALNYRIEAEFHKQSHNLFDVLIHRTQSSSMNEQGVGKALTPTPTTNVAESKHA